MSEEIPSPHPTRSLLEELRQRLVAGEVVFSSVGRGYRLLRELGAGEASVVWLAKNLLLEDKVALRFMAVGAPDSEMESDFFDRWRKAATLRHRNIVGSVDLLCDRSLFAVAMEYVDGPSVAQLIAAGRNLEIERIKRIAQGLCEAADYAENLRRPIVHGDIKPANLFIDQRETVKVGNFGLAPPMAEFVFRQMARARAHPGVGSLPYLSPQALRGEDSPANDIYSIGATIYELITGAPPFRAQDPATLLAQINGHAPPPMVDRRREIESENPGRRAGTDFIPRHWERGVAACLQKDSAQRPRSAREVAWLLADSNSMEPMPHSSGSAASPVSAARGNSGSAGPRPISASAPSGAGGQRGAGMSGRLAWIPSALAAMGGAVAGLFQGRPSVSAASGGGGAPARKSRADARAESGSRPVRAVSPRMDDNVQFTVYRPRDVVPDKWHTLLAFAHLAEKGPDSPFDPLAEVARQAGQILGSESGDYKTLTQDSTQSLPREGTITFVPAVDGVTFNPPQRSFVWSEPVHREEFRLRVDAGSEEGIRRGQLTVFLGAIIVAEVSLALQVRAQPPASAPKQNLEAAHGRPYRKIFASYSHRDMAIVTQFERYAATMGDRYLRDWVNLRSGEVWDEQLCRMIEESDVFQLFWSNHSMQSEFVRREWEHALSLNRPNFVRPVYWERPIPKDPSRGLPPPSLRRLHFQRLANADGNQTDADEAPAIGPSPTKDAPAVLKSAEPVPKRPPQPGMGGAGTNRRDAILELEERADLFRRQGQADRAEPYDRQAAESSARTLGNISTPTIQRRNTLAITLIMLGRLDEARQLLDPGRGSFAATVLATAPRLFLLRLIIARLKAEAEPAAFFLGQLKRLLTDSELPAPENGAPWEVGYLLDHLREKLGAENFKFLVALLEAINRRATLADLGRFPQWRDQPALGPDALWPGETR